MKKHLMNFTFQSLWLLLFSLVLFSCSPQPKPETEEGDSTAASTAESVQVTTESMEVPDAHTSENSLDWTGKYEGVLPCADCEGIETKVELKRDNSYQMETTYLGKGASASRRQKGTFTWDESGLIITLSGMENTPSKYKVGENKIIQLDMQGHVITGALADRYVLKKEGH
jgi:uncharacterized lipoprotein NlpE involved in copper resistance